MMTEYWGKEAPNILQERNNKQHGIKVLFAALKACSRTRNLERGKRIHAELIECGHDCNVFLVDALINMYAKCRSMVDAREVFDGMKVQTVVSWTALIFGYAENDEGDTALDMFTRMKTEGPASNAVTLLAALKACTSLAKEPSRWGECTERGKEIHNIAMEYDCTDVYMQSTLVDMYAKCGSMVDAHDIFDSMKHPDVVSWTALILGYANNGQAYVALDLFSRMRNEGSAPDSLTLVASLKACTTLAIQEGPCRWAECRDMGKEIHNSAVENGCNSNVYVQSTLVDMYAKCGSIIEARAVFDGIKLPTVVSWNVLILGYVENGKGHTALDMFTRMRFLGHAPDFLTLVAALKACTCIAMKEGPGLWAECRKRGKEIHKEAIEHGCNSDVYVQNSLIDMYSKCGSMIDAREVFDSMKHSTVTSWTALIMGYADNGESQTALDMFTSMRIVGLAPNSVTLVGVLKACTSIAEKYGCTQCRGKEVHNLVVENGCNSDAYVQNSLIDMYAKCGSLLHAREVFDSIEHSTVVSWTVLIRGYVENGQNHIALDMFTKMRTEGHAPDSVTLVVILKSCTSLALKTGAWGECMDRGKEIHNVAVENANLDVYVQNSLIDMYAKCGSMLDARQVFNSMKHANVVSWNTLISGYVENGEFDTALDMFTRTRTHRPVTVVAALKASTSIALKEGASRWVECRDRGKQIHTFAVENGCNSDPYVQSTVIDMHAKCGSMVDAREHFDSMKHPDVVSWTALILGYAENGQGQTALEMFTKMRAEGPAPNLVTFGAVLKACGLVGALDFGRTIHSELDNENDLNVVLVTCLVDFYAKCGSLLEAQSVFDRHAETRDVVTWNALLAGFSSRGDYETVFELFDGMQDAGFTPDGITFLCILTCCSHAGLVAKGKEYFEAMSTKYAVIPTVKHYTCMIDLFGRANKLDDAMALVKCMPCRPPDVTWRTILNACRKWKNVEIGRLAFQSLVDLNDRDVDIETGASFNDKTEKPGKEAVQERSPVSAG